MPRLLQMVPGLIVVVVVWGCASGLLTGFSDASEVVFADATANEIINVLTAEMAVQGYQTKSSQENSLVFGKEERKGLPPVTPQEKCKPLPERRVSYMLAKADEGIKVRACTKVFADPSRGVEECPDFFVRWHDAQGLQHLMERAKARLAAQRATPSQTKQASLPASAPEAKQKLALAQPF